MNAALVRLVWQRAAHCCEYCQMPQSLTSLPHEIDHIRSKKHHGRSVLSNLCLACANCNAFKGSDVAAYDPASGKLTELFNPRLDAWADHFAWRGPRLFGKTARGRATVALLRINLSSRLEHRRMLVTAGVFLPKENRG